MTDIDNIFASVNFDKAAKSPKSKPTQIHISTTEDICEKVSQIRSINWGVSKAFNDAIVDRVLEVYNLPQFQKALAEQKVKVITKQ